nr:MAG TPA: hypothetical protein [Caudoviricetes sp.]
MGKLREHLLNNKYQLFLVIEEGQEVILKRW